MEFFEYNLNRLKYDSGVDFYRRMVMGRCKYFVEEYECTKLVYNQTYNLQDQ